MVLFYTPLFGVYTALIVAFRRGLSHPPLAEFFDRSNVRASRERPLHSVNDRAEQVRLAAGQAPQPLESLDLSTRLGVDLRVSRRALEERDLCHDHQRLPRVVRTVRALLHEQHLMGVTEWGEVHSAHGCDLSEASAAS